LFNRIAESIGINRVVLALALARLGDAVGNSILFIVIPLYVAKLPAPFFPFQESVRVGILISLYGVINSLLQPVLGALSDKLGRRKLLIQIGLLIMGLSTFSFVFASRFTDLLLLRSLQGIGVALTIPASMAIMATATQKNTRGGSMGVYSAMRMLGFAIGPLIGGSLFDRYGFNLSFYVGTGFILLGFLMVQIWVKEMPVKLSERPVGRVRIFDPQLLSIGIIGAGIATFIMASDFSMISALENQINIRLDQTALDFGIAFSALMVGRLIFQVPLGRWSDRIGRKPLIIGGLVLMAPATFLLGEAASTFQFVGIRVFQGLASAAIAAPAFALAADLSKAGGEGRQMSLITMGFGLGIAFGPLMAGILAVPSFVLPFMIGGVLTLLAAWIVYRYVPETVEPEGGEERVKDSHVSIQKRDSESSG
jgi:MFS family permease